VLTACGIDARIDTLVRGRSVTRYVNDWLGQALVGHGNLTASDTSRTSPPASRSRSRRGSARAT
jgi:hypothetical protein